MVAVVVVLVLVGDGGGGGDDDDGDIGGDDDDDDDLHALPLRLTNDPPSPPPFPQLHLQRVLGRFYNVKQHTPSPKP